SEGWVLLIEPKSRLGEALSIHLAGQLFKTIRSSFFTGSKPSTLMQELAEPLAPLFSELNINSQYLLANESAVTDKRIQQLLTQLNQCLQGECIKPSSWRACDVASQLALSESRFLHLFSKELGVAWRPYLLWRRMMCAIQAIKHNASATEAAHLSGFSDSAHLSRTFRHNFGMSIREAQTLFK
ncbi:MAG: helix-turn-helix transcriptional regulator, partial [Colwellia sp.]|nr:helix-turn-helix transcriptional regulator [Colwellia sp.]